MPGIVNIIDILLGEDGPTAEACGDDWERIILSNILYKSPPSFSLQSITYLLELTSHSPSSSSSSDFKILVLQLLEGQVGPLFKYLYECFFKNEVSMTRGLGLFPPSSSSLLGSSLIEQSIKKISLVPQLAVAQLAYILGIIGILESDANGGENDMGIEFSVGKNLTEELTLSAVENLSTMNYPIEIISCYIRSCPYNGSEYARVILPRRGINSDKDAIQVASTLRSFGFEREACVLEISRGLYWLKARKNLLKGLHFFVKANDKSRMDCLIEEVTWRCIASLLDDEDKSSFHLPSFPRKPMLGTKVGVTGSMGASTEDLNRGTGDEASSELQNSFELARDVLALVGADAYTPHIFLPRKDTFVSSTVWFLFYYVRIVSNAKSKSNEGSFSVQLVVENFMEAAKCISIVLDSDDGHRNAAPLRYWTHLIDIAVWLEDRYSELLSSIPEYEDEALTQAYNDGRFPINLFTKKEAYTLMESLDKVCTSLSAERLMCYAPVEAVVSMRKKLMRIWCNAVIDDNGRKKINVPIKKVEVERIQDAHNTKDNGRFPHRSDVSEAISLITAI